MKSLDTLISGLVRTLIHSGASRPDAEDLAQEAFLKVWIYSQTKLVFNQEAFLKHAAKHLHTDLRRRISRHLAVCATLRVLEGSLFLNAPKRPDEVLAVDERLQTVERLLKKKKGLRTCIIFLAHRAGYSHEEIASYYAITTGAVEKHIAAAVKVLMEAKKFK